MTKAMFRSPLLALLTIGMIAGVSAQAQIPNANVFRPSRGFHPTGTYSLSDTESVNDTNGNVTIRLPLAKTPPGRNGSGFALNLVYNSAFYSTRSQQTEAAFDFDHDPLDLVYVDKIEPDYGGTTSGGWGYNYRYALETDTRDCNVPGFGWWSCTRMTLVTGDGGSHQLWLRVPNQLHNDNDGYSYYGLTGRNTPGSWYSGPNLTYYTTDGSFIRVEVTTDPGTGYSGTWRAVFPNGDYVMGPIVPNGWQKDADQICDRNGNCTQIINTVDPATGLVATTELKDSLNREVVLTHSLSATSGIDEVRVLPYGANVASSSDPRDHATSPVTRVHWDMVSAGAPATAAVRGITYQCRVTSDPGTSHTCIVYSSFRAVMKVELPNSLQYEFRYAGNDDSTPEADRARGEIREMQLPSLAAEASPAKASYKWARREQPLSGLAPIFWFDANINPLETKTLTYREESGDQSPFAATRVWGYAFSQDQSVITAPDGGQTTHRFTSRGDTFNWKRGLVHKMASPAGTTWRCWQKNEPWIGVAAGQDPRNPYVASEYRQLPDGSLPVAATGFDYDKNGNQMTKLEYNWVSAPSSDEVTACAVSGTVLRKTESRYYNPPGGALSPVRATDPISFDLTNAYWTPAANPKRDSLLETRTYQGNEGNPANAKVLTQFSYDNPNTTGNVTQELRWDNQLLSSAPSVATTAPTLSSGSAAVTTRAYISGAPGLLDSETDPHGSVTKFAYSSLTGCPSSYSNLYPTSATLAFGSAEAQVHQYEYDCATGVLKTDLFVTNQNFRTTYSHDVYGRVTQEVAGADQTDPAKKRITVTEYEDSNRRVRVVQDSKLGAVSAFNQLGQLYLQRENADTASSPISAGGTDGIHNVTVERTTTGAHYVLSSNPHLNGVADTEPTMGWTLQRLDLAGRVAQVSTYRGAAKPSPFGTNTTLTGSTTYTYSGATTTVTDASGASRSTTVDALGRIASASDAAGSAAYIHDVLDNLTTVTQTDTSTYGSSKTQTRTFAYSSLGRLLSANNPEADGVTTYTYFPAGALHTKTDPRGVTTTFTIDSLGRVLKKDYSSTTPATPNGRYCYDGKAYNSTNDSCQAQSRSDYPVGSLTHSAARRSNGTLLSQTEFTNIDPLGRVLASRQTTDGLAAMNFAYQYAVGGALSGIQYPSGRWVTYTINGANRASAVRNGQSGTSYYMQNVQYKPSGAFLSATVGLDTANQWTETREYNSLLQARKLRLMKGAQKVLGLDWIYSANSQYNSSQDMYEETGTDNNGNLRMEKLAHTVGTPFSVDRSFGYDAANRLGSFSEPSKSQSFGYDAFGNLWQTAATGVPALRPNGSSWYLLGSGQVSNRLVNTAYDAAGHQTQLSLTPGTTASYDAEGRVSRVELNSTPVATYDYDADGRRVKKTVGATTTYYVYSADGQLMAEYGGTPASVGTRYLVADHLGSTRLILDAQGNCAERIDYAPFGAQLTRSGQPCYTSSTSGLPLFTGQIRDGESTAGTDTGLDYFNARYFWAALGRFSSPDAPFADQDVAVPQSWNLYSYGRNNPLFFIDPTGRCSRAADGGYTDAGDSLFPGPCASGVIGGSGAGSSATVSSDADEDPSESEYARMFFNEMSRRRTASNQFIGAFAGASIVAGTGVGLALQATGGAGLTTLTNITPNNLVYQSINAAGDVQYVGITSSFARREAQHAARFVIQRIPGLLNLTRAEARAVEQVLIEKIGLAKNGGTLLNQINSIASTNPIYANSLKVGAQILKNIGYPGF